jgi:ABC-type branched-subunit amino acid transport system substrate-binding protein
VYYPELSSPEGIALVARHEQRFGTKPKYNIWMAISYDRVHLLARAIHTCGEDTSCIKDWLHSLQSYKGVTGNISFDSNGDVIGLSHAVFEIQDGKTVRIG